MMSDSDLAAVVDSSGGAKHSEARSHLAAGALSPSSSDRRLMTCGFCGGLKQGKLSHSVEDKGGGNMLLSPVHE